MRVNGRRSGGRYVSTDADPKRTFLRDFGSNARSAPPPPKKKLLSPPHNRRRSAKPIQHSCHTFRTRTHAGEGVNPCVRVIEMVGRRGCWPHTSGTVILAPSAGLFFFNIVLFKSHMCTHAHMHTCATGQG